MTDIRLHCKIFGRVQGVFFRASTCDEATRLGLTGWVHNCADGCVECVAEGPKAKLNELRAWLNHGPPAAHVTRVEDHWGDATGDYHDFSAQ